MSAEPGFSSLESLMATLIAAGIYLAFARSTLEFSKAWRQVEQSFHSSLAALAPVGTDDQSAKCSSSAENWGFRLITCRRESDKHEKSKETNVLLASK